MSACEHALTPDVDVRGYMSCADFFE